MFTQTERADFLFKTYELSEKKSIQLLVDAKEAQHCFKDQ
jgi:hypothetical protein